MMEMKKMDPNNLRSYKFSEEVMPELDEEEFTALREDIKENGVKHPVDISKDNEILDGHHRWRIAKELGLDVPVNIIDAETEREKKAWVIKANLLRRQLSTKQKYRLYAELSKNYERGRGKNPRGEDGKFTEDEQSASPDVNERTAEEVGESPRTIAKARKYARIVEKNPELKKIKSPHSVLIEHDRRKRIKKRVEESKDVEIKNLKLGNCLEKITEVKDNSVDCLLTDPPYGDFSIGDHCRGETLKTRKDWNYHKQGGKEIFSFFEELFPKLKNKLKDDAHIYIFTNWKNWGDLETVASRYFDVKNCIIYSYGVGLGSITYTNYRPCYGMILFASNGKERKLNTKENKNFIKCEHNPPKHHPAEKGMDTLKELIENSTVEGEVVFDPFAGSGSTLVAAEELGRNWIGIEIEKRWYDIAKSRIAEVRNG